MVQAVPTVMRVVHWLLSGLQKAAGSQIPELVVLVVGLPEAQAPLVGRAVHVSGVPEHKPVRHMESLVQVAPLSSGVVHRLFAQ